MIRVEHHHAALVRGGAESIDGVLVGPGGIRSRVRDFERVTVEVENPGAWRRLAEERLPGDLQAEDRLPPDALDVATGEPLVRVVAPVLARATTLRPRRRTRRRPRSPARRAPPRPPWKPETAA